MGHPAVVQEHAVKDLVPGIEDDHSQAFKVPYISSDQGQAVFKCSGGNQAILDLQPFAPQFCLSCQQPPALRNRFVHWEDSAFKPWPQSLSKPSPKLAPALAFRKSCDSLGNLAQGNNADVQLFVVHVLQPLGYARFREGLRAFLLLL